MVKGVSVITCTKRPGYIFNLLDNYHRQKWPKKELVIILHNDKINIAKYKKYTNRYDNVSVYQLPEKLSLGKCLNFGVKQTKYRYVAKFDDDDFYAPAYLDDSMRVFRKTKAHIIGKRAHFIWLKASKTLLLRSPHVENKFVSYLPGATLVFKKKVFSKVRFPDRTVGEDTKFCKVSKSQGFKVYSSGKYNFVAVRRKNSSGHTWIISDKKLLERKAIVFPHVRDYKSFVTR